MNKKTTIIALLAALSLSLMLVWGCSKKSSGGLMEDEFEAYPAATQFERARGLAYDDSATQWEGTGFNSPAGVEGQTPPAASTSADAAMPAQQEAERKLVKSAQARIRVENLAAADASVTALLEKYEAYAASTRIEENVYNYSLRVPAPAYDAFLAEMNGMGRLLRRSESIEDVTLRYYDLEGRLETKKELLRTFQSYLGKAKTIDEILAVEKRISELQYDIEGTGKQLRNLANRVDYATVDLTLLGPVAAAENRGETLGERLGRMFGGFGGFLAGMVVVILGIIIYGIPIVLLVVVFFWLLLGRIGLLKKLWRLVRGKKQAT